MGLLINVLMILKSIVSCNPEIELDFKAIIVKNSKVVRKLPYALKTKRHFMAKTSMFK